MIPNLTTRPDIGGIWTNNVQYQDMLEEYYVERDKLRRMYRKFSRARTLGDARRCRELLSLIVEQIRVEAVAHVSVEQFAVGLIESVVADMEGRPPEWPRTDNEA